MRKHLTYANVMVTLLAIGALTGGVAYAANTIFSTDIVNGEVKSVDIGTGQVQSVDVKNEGLTGVDISEPTLQNINAGTVGGLQVRKINFQVPFGTGPTTVLDLAGLQITAECQTFGDVLDVKAFTSKNDASLYYTAMSASTADDTNAIKDIASDRLPDKLFDVGSQFQIDNESPPNNPNGTLHYWAPDGSVVVAHLALDRISDEGGCAMTGIATGG